VAATKFVTGAFQQVEQRLAADTAQLEGRIVSAVRLSCARVLSPNIRPGCFVLLGPSRRELYFIALQSLFFLSLCTIPLIGSPF
jgi:hypothetical protein